MSGISVVVPVFNEVESVGKAAESIRGALKGAGIKYEIILVDDCSTDGTRELLEKTNAEDVTVIYHRRNRGYGAALKTGIKRSGYDNVFIIDCDGTYPADRLPEMAEMLLGNECDMIVGARVGNSVMIPVVRRPAKWMIQRLAEYLTSERIPDLNSGFRGMKKKALLRFLPLLPDGFSFTTTITIAMLTNDYNVRYVKINYHKRVGKSKIDPIRDTVGFIKLVIRTVLYFNPLKIFLPLTGILAIAGAAVFFYTYFFTEKVFDNTVTVILLAAFQIFAIGLIADLIDKRMK